MDWNLINKIDELIKIFDNSEEIKRMKELKKIIYKDPTLKNRLEQFNDIRDNVHDEKFLELKREVLAIDHVKEYKKMENELYLLTLEMNNRLNRLTNDKRCHHENN